MEFRMLQQRFAKARRGGCDFCCRTKRVPGKERGTLIIKYVIHPNSCQRLDYNVLTRSHAHFMDFSFFDVTFWLAREAARVRVHLGGKTINRLGHLSDSFAPGNKNRHLFCFALEEYVLSE